MRGRSEIFPFLWSLIYDELRIQRVIMSCFRYPILSAKHVCMLHSFLGLLLFGNLGTISRSKAQDSPTGINDWECILSVLEEVDI
jgi:hypothetical protein